MEESVSLRESQAISYQCVPGSREDIGILKEELTRFTAELENTRCRIEGTVRCYNLLDKVCFSCVQIFLSVSCYDITYIVIM